MELLFFLIYTVLALYVGYRCLSGRFVWLDGQAPVNRITKIVLSLMLGYIIAGVYLFYWIWKLIQDLCS